MNLQNNEPAQSSQNIWTIILSVVVTALLVGGGFMLFQKNQTDILRKEIQALRIQNEKISQDLMEAKKVTVIQEYST